MKPVVSLLFFSTFILLMGNISCTSENPGSGLPINPGSGLTITVTNGYNIPVPDSAIVTTPSTGSNLLTDANGILVISDPPAGQIEVTASISGLGSISGTVTVSSGMPASLDLVYDTGYFSDSLVDYQPPVISNTVIAAMNIVGQSTQASVSTGTLPLRAGINDQWVDPQLPFNIPVTRSMGASTPRGTRATDGAIGSTHVFWAIDISKATDDPAYHYQITACKLAENNSCMVFGQGTSISNAAAVSISQAVAWTCTSEYDSVIVPMLTTNFGSMPDVDSNGKQILLYYDIQDGYQNPGDAYIAGFFNPIDLFSYDAQGNPYTNQMDMLNLDCNPSIPDTVTAWGVIAHENQHMINFSANWTEAEPAQQETWIDEGLAEAANQMYRELKGDDVLYGRIAYYNQDPENVITNGHPLVSWDPNSDDTVLANYSLSYLFMQYLAIAAGDTGIFEEIINQPDEDYRAVVAVAKAHGIADSFPELLVKWASANYLNRSSGPYGYGGKAGFNLTAHLTAQGTASLGPGAIIYKSSPGGSFTASTDTSPFIAFAGLSQ